MDPAATVMGEGITETYGDAGFEIGNPPLQPARLRTTHGSARTIRLSQTMISHQVENGSSRRTRPLRLKDATVRPRFGFSEGDSSLYRPQSRSRCISKWVANRTSARSFLGMEARKPSELGSELTACPLRAARNSSGRPRLVFRRALAPAGSLGNSWLASREAVGRTRSADPTTQSSSLCPST